MVDLRKLDATPLHLAAGSGKVDKVRELLRPYNVNCTDEYGQTPLHYASSGGHLAVVRVLVMKYKAGLTMRDTFGNTALLLAAKYGHDRLVFFLLSEYHCPVDDTNKLGQTLLHFATQRSSLVQTLLHDCGYDPNKADILGKSLLHYACEQGDIKSINTLMQRHKAETVVDIYALDNNQLIWPFLIVIQK